jgi:hypothetical protein
MTRSVSRTFVALVLVATFVTLAFCAAPPQARAFDATKPICTLAGLVSGLAGKVCSAARHAGSVLQAGQKLLSGHLGAAAETLTGAGTATKAITATAALAAMALWVTRGAKLVLRETAVVISATTRPQLESTWFSSSYWRMAGISALLTLPFLFAAAIQALVRSDPSLLARSALGYLPLCALAVAIAAPVTQLLLAASDELSGLVSSASGYSSAGFAHVTGLGIGVSFASTFPVFFIGLLAVAATVTLWIELLIRSAAVYVIVLMLPLFFAALVWPARRIWAVRAIELLMALILSKFAIVAVLALGGAALGHTALPSVTQMLAGTTLVMLAAFTPWALLRLLPLHELAAGVEGMRGAGARGLASADAGATHALDMTEEFRAELAEAHAHRSPTGGGHQSGAGSALAGLNAAESRGEGEPVPTAGGDGEPMPTAGGDGEPMPTAGGQASAAPASGSGDAGSTPGTAGNEATGTEDGERLPGMGSAWQRGNLTWRTLELGPDTLPEDELGALPPPDEPAAPDAPGPPPDPPASPEGDLPGGALDRWAETDERRGPQ